MAFFDTTWYCNFGNGTSTAYWAVPMHAASTAYVAGQVVRQLTAPALNNERCFVCIVAGTSAAATDATWVLTRGAKTTDGTVTWIECTGASAMNGDLANTQSWAQVKAIGSSVTIGQIIKRNNGVSYQVCTLSSGSTGATEPAFSDVAGTTTVDGSATWTSLGPVGNFTAGGAPFARLFAVFVGGWFASGNTVYVGDNHAETQASNISIGGFTSALMAKIICHNHASNYPPTAADLMTSAVVACTGSATLSFNPGGSFYIYGITFIAGTGGIIMTISATGGCWYYFDQCSLQQTGANPMWIGSTGSAWAVMIFNNTTVKFSLATTYISPAFCQLTWQNTGPIFVAGSVIPSILFQPTTGGSGCVSNITLLNLDLSQFTNSLYSGANHAYTGVMLVQDCKLNAAMTVTRPANSGMRIEFVRSDTVANSYKTSRITYEASETTETVVVRTDGAIDPAGNTQSRKIATSANDYRLRPYQSEPYAVWNDRVGVPLTVTLYGNVNDIRLPYNDELWMDVEYLSSASYPLGSIVSTSNAPSLSPGAPLAVDDSIWSLPPIAYASFDGIPTNATVSNFNLTATHLNTTTNSGARSTSQKNSGKYYFEVVTSQTTGSFDCVGIATAAATYTDIVTTGSNCAMQYHSGSIYTNNVSAGNVSLLNNGYTVCVAVDLDIDKIWFQTFFGWNSDVVSYALENPVTGAGGISIVKYAGTTLSPAIGFGGTTGSGSSYTANFGASPFFGNIPNGFVAWGSATTFDGVSSNATLTNGNLTATHSAAVGNSGVRSTDQRNSGKFYFEVLVLNTTAAADMIGLLTAGGTYADYYNGVNCGSTYLTGGTLYGDDAFSGKSIGSTTTSYIVGVAADLDANKMWFRCFRWNTGGVAHNPNTGVGGYSISNYSGTTVAPAIGFGAGVAGDNMTINCGQAPFALAAPTGFTKWTTASSLVLDAPEPTTTLYTLDGSPINTTMSGGNLIATHANTGLGGVNSTSFDGPAVGNLGIAYYFEVTLLTSVTNGNSIGFMDPGTIVTDRPGSPTGGTQNKFGVVLSPSSSIFYRTEPLNNIICDFGPTVVGDVWGVAANLDNYRFWFRKNGGLWNMNPSADPATDIGGAQVYMRSPVAPCCAFAAGTYGDVMKFNFGQNSFVGTPPLGPPTGGGDGGLQWLEFKMTATVTPQQAGYIHVRVRAARPLTTYFIDPKIVLS